MRAFPTELEPAPDWLLGGFIGGLVRDGHVPGYVPNPPLCRLLRNQQAEALHRPGMQL